MRDAGDIIIEDMQWNVLDGSTTPWGGLWFTVEIENIEKWRDGSLHSQFDVLGEDEDVPHAVEEPEHIYIELDPERGEARARLQTVLVPAWQDLESSGHRRAISKRPPEDDPDFKHDIFIYTSTLRTLKARKTQKAIEQVVNATLLKWAQAPFASGEKMKVPHSARMEPSIDFARQVFDVDTAFYGLG
jgi:hypothetical protein